jgi:hypothetical protein
MRAALVALILLEALLPTARTTQFCVDLVLDDVTCTGYHDNFPSKVCLWENFISYSSSFICDPPAIFSAWQGLCPKKNLNVSQQFCEGTGFITPWQVYPVPCLGLRECESDEDCNIEYPPLAPTAHPPLLCYECCIGCFEEEICQERVKSNDTYTNSPICTSCKPNAPKSSPISQPTGPTSSEPVTAVNEHDSEGGLNIAPWVYVVAAVAVVAPLILLVALLFRHKCSKVAHKYGGLDETSVNMVEIDE